VLTSVEPFQADHQAGGTLLGASGYESRCVHVARELRVRGGAAVGFLELADHPQRRVNDRDFGTLGVEVLPACSGNDDGAIARALEQMSARGVREVILDISSMTRVWYAGVVRFLFAYNGPAMKVHFAYAPSAWNPAVVEPAANAVVRPIEGFESCALPDRPTALVIGLGAEPGRALGLREYMDPPLVATFSPQSAVENRFNEAIRSANLDVWARTPPAYRFVYPVLEPRYTFAYLESFVSGLSKDCCVVLAALGPKIFGLCAVLVAGLHATDVSVWRVSRATGHLMGDIRAQGPIVGLTTVWS
jgi:hypothetical protein